MVTVCYREEEAPTCFARLYRSKADQKLKDIAQYYELPLEVLTNCNAHLASAARNAKLRHMTEVRPLNAPTRKEPFA